MKNKGTSEKWTDKMAHLPAVISINSAGSVMTRFASSGTSGNAKNPPESNLIRIVCEHWS